MEDLVRSYREVHIDIGTGDGSYVIKSACKHPETFFIGIDINVENLEYHSRNTSLFSEKRGLKNALFVQASIENLPSELLGLASKLTILLPWGSLLKAISKPEIELLREVRKLCNGNATIQIIFGYEDTVDQNQFKKLGVSELIYSHLDMLISLYSKVGFRSLQWRYLTQEELKTIPSTWAKKLAYGRKRRFVEIWGQIYKTKTL